MLFLLVYRPPPAEDADLVLHGVDDVADGGEDDEEDDDDDCDDDVCLHHGCGREGGEARGGELWVEDGVWEREDLRWEDCSVVDGWVGGDRWRCLSCSVGWSDIW